MPVDVFKFCSDSTFRALSTAYLQGSGQATVSLLSPNNSQELNVSSEMFSAFCSYFTWDVQLFPQYELGTTAFRFLAEHFWNKP